jgi:hypothetical protein
VRAAARGLLDPGDGCPLTRRYLLREVLVLQELARDEGVTLSKTMANMHASGAQAMVLNPGSQVWWKLYEHANDQALLAYQRMGRLMRPWDQSWSEALDTTQRRIYDRAHEIGETGLSDQGIIQLITLYEREKQRRAQGKNEPSGSGTD